jgi:hypothetical protein
MQTASAASPQQNFHAGDSVNLQSAGFGVLPVSNPPGSFTDSTVGSGESIFEKVSVNTATGQ